MSRRRSLIKRPRMRSVPPTASVPVDAPTEVDEEEPAAGASEGAGDPEALGPATAGEGPPMIDPASVDPEMLFDDQDDLTLEEASEDVSPADPPEPDTGGESGDLADDLSLDLSDDAPGPAGVSWEEDVDADTIVDRPLSAASDTWVDAPLAEDPEAPEVRPVPAPVLGDTGVVAPPLPDPEADTQIAAPPPMPSEAETVVVAPPPEPEPVAPAPPVARGAVDPLHTVSMVFFGLGMGMAVMFVVFGFAVITGMIELGSP